jgi:hypothetical protein
MQVSLILQLIDIKGLGLICLNCDPDIISDYIDYNNICAKLFIGGTNIYNHKEFIEIFKGVTIINDKFKIFNFKKLIEDINLKFTHLKNKKLYIQYIFKYKNCSNIWFSFYEIEYHF